MSGIKKEQLLKLKYPSFGICTIPEIIASRNIGGVFQSNCEIAKETLGFFSGLGSREAIEMILDGLKVRYTNELDLDSYLDLLDGKTTKAVRQAIKRILKEPMAAKYSEQLNSKVFEYNREVEEVAKTRTAKFFDAVSEMTVYAGDKLIEQKSKGLLKLGDVQKQHAKEALASTLVDIQSTLTGKDWSIAQIYKTKCKIENIKSLKNRNNLSV